MCKISTYLIFEKNGKWERIDRKNGKKIEKSLLLEAASGDRVKTKIYINKYNNISGRKTEEI